MMKIGGIFNLIYSVSFQNSKMVAAAILIIVVLSFSVLQTCSIRCALNFAVECGEDRSNKSDMVTVFRNFPWRQPPYGK